MGDQEEIVSLAQKKIANETNTEIPKSFRFICLTKKGRNKKGIMVSLVRINIGVSMVSAVVFLVKQK